MTLRGAHIHARIYADEAFLEAGCCPKGNRGGTAKFVSATEYDSKAKGAGLEFTKGDFFRITSSFEGYYIKVGGSCHFNGVRALGLIRISGGLFGGKVAFKGASLEQIPCSNLQESADSYSRRSHKPRGCLDAFGAQFKGSLYFGGEGSQSSGSYIGLICFRGAQVDGRVIFGRGDYCMNLTSGSQNSSGNHRRYSLDFGNAVIGRSVYFLPGFRSGRTVRFKGAVIRAQLDISGSSFSAMDAEKITKLVEDAIDEIGSECENFDQFEQQVRKKLIDEANRDHQFICADFSGCKIDHDVKISEGSLSSTKEPSNFRGTFKIRGASIKGNLRLSSGEQASVFRSCYSPNTQLKLGFHSDNNKTWHREARLQILWAINAEHVDIGGDLRLGDDSFKRTKNKKEESSKKRRFSLADIYPFLETRLRRKAASAQGDQSDLYGVAGHFKGKAVFHHAKIDGALDIRGYNEEDKVDFELHLEHVHAGSLRADEFLPKGGRGKKDGEGALKIDGLTYNATHRDFLMKGDKIWEAWLKQRSRENFKAQPYRQLANLFREKGMPNRADRVEIMLAEDYSESITCGWSSKVFGGLFLACIASLMILLQPWLVFLYPILCIPLLRKRSRTEKHSYCFPIIRSKVSFARWAHY